jgi:hypothetical protein
MGSKNPQPTAIVGDNRLPIRTILESAESYVALLNGKAHEAEAFLEWARNQMDEFVGLLERQPQLHQDVYHYVYMFVSKTNRCAPTSVIEEGLKNVGTPTGVRGSLSRLVRDGILIRPAVGNYWPADVLYGGKSRI